jgi:phage protein D
MVVVLRSKPPGDPNALRRAITGPVDIFSPHYYVRVQERGGAWTDITDRTLDLSHTDSGGRKMSRAEITIDNSYDWALRQEALSRKGAKLLVSYGYPGAMREDLEFVAKELKANPNQLTITGHERKRSRLQRRMAARTWYDATDAEVVRDLFAGQGVDPSEIHITDTTDRHEVIEQTAESAWNFAEELAARNGYALWADDTGTHWEPPPRSKPPQGVFRQVRGVIGIGVIKSYSVESFGAGVPGRIILAGRDRRTGRPYRVEASETATTGIEPLVETDDMPTPDEGDRLDDGDTGYEIIKYTGAPTEAEAKRTADALYEMYRTAAMKLELTIFGDPTIRVHTQRLVVGISPFIDGIYTVKEEAVHRLGGGGYEGTVKLARGGRKKPGVKDDAAQQALDFILGATSPFSVITKLRDQTKR